MLLLTDEEIGSLTTVRDCVDVMESAYRDLAEGRAVEEPRERMFVDNQGDGHVYALGRQCGALPCSGISALRVMSGRRGAARNPHDHHLVFLFGLEHGELQAILQGFTLSGLRLGATTAIAAKYLARKDAEQVGVFGSGKQARANLEGIVAVTRIKRALVFSPNPSHRNLFCDEMGHRLGIELVPVEKPKDVLNCSEIVLCASNAWEPIFDGNWVEEGALVISLRNSDRQKRPREFDETTIKRSSFVVVCSKKQIHLDDQRELLDPIERGATTWHKIYELADLVAGKVPGRESPKEIVFYHSNAGMGVQFAAAGFKALEMARKVGAGRNLPDGWFFTDLTPWWNLGFRPTP